MTTPESQPENWTKHVQLGPPKLSRLEFAVEEVEFTEEIRVKVEYSLGINRLSELAIGVEFGATIVGVEGLTASAAYRMTLSLAPGSPAALEPERAFVPLLIRIAPRAMFPYVREVLGSAAQRALMPAVVLPLTDVGGLWTPDEVKIPPMDDEEDSTAK